MPITAPGLAAEVWAGYLAVMPTAAGALRANPATGVPPHNVPLAFITALATAWSSVLPHVPILAQVTGTADLPGLPPIPAPFQLPGSPAAVAAFLASSGWVGPVGAVVADAWIGGLLRATAHQGLLLMGACPTVGTGVGVVSPATNPGLAALLLPLLSTALPVAFQAAGVFGTGDVPGAPVNPLLAAQLPRYASALATGLASIIAAPGYVGTATVPAPAVGISSGAIL